MWALRAAVRPGARLSRVARGCGAPKAAPPLPPCPKRTVAAFRGGAGGPEGREGGRWGPGANGWRSRAGEEEPEDAEEEEEEEELLRRDPLLPAGTQRVFLIHPEVKWGPRKPQGTRAEWQVAEAQALVRTLDGWSVVDTAVVPTKTPDRRLIFGKGTLEHLTGESSLQVQQRLLKDKELRIRRALERLRGKRLLLGRQRRRREFPVISVVGYTNCGKTTLIKALTGDAAVQPRDQLFATLDVTAHAGSLPSRMAVIYMDTIGFLSQLPHSLIESFSATLEDVAHSDLIVHVRDVSHPETELQKDSVLSALRGLRLPAVLLDHVLEVHNKVDLVPGYKPMGPHAVAVSALLGLGLEELKARLEDAVLTATGRRVLTLRVRLAGAQLSWLHKEATVQAVDVMPEAGAADVKVIISHSAYGRFRKLFPE
ncbi:putative GTP-binding protein 6 isoform X3 [Phacochoerus africanus]|uniref:putative GTP-binding protein 6 isoform X3 n=1 Tax=Phacochoerus africanus TaxID=41426 RepID=UPI001FD88FC6|nr:putative GTP-binding protein 6 isoform X3 [Phacochoerus africanus]